ncbi:methylated-DNA--[protein]-cysteine S-methyltransferase [Tenggerimyces flavus]|uniref:Methylated-DNA--[protein]-cysteine S-methyltransferase n=1 Tax=Tenggerimyces flavus TaxID=1708749 RepID=A0ABV7YPY4_9ACTN|nr:methylated-DNA--[protein]-cysteine S-methyltransferase [Tenggerimyces flavus]MBM7785756.1 methylated-DNA-[protein]-cysteine S-methyltransferase [Tenggerimyces flavus]
MSIEEMLAGSACQDELDKVTQLQDLLAVKAEDVGALDVAYRTVASPVGDLLLAATDRGVVRVAFLHDDEDAVLQGLSDQLSPRILRAPRRLDWVAIELDEYFAGTRHSFSTPVDLALARGFRRAVLDHLPEIAYGTTASYARVAELAGSPKAFRAVGTACALNPVPIVIPCHRVVKSDGSMGLYAGGVAAKKVLLGLEAA